MVVTDLWTQTGMYWQVVICLRAWQATPGTKVGICRFQDVRDKMDVKVYTKEGPARGYETTPEAWTVRRSAVVSDCFFSFWGVVFFWNRAVCGVLRFVVCFLCSVVVCGLRLVSDLGGKVGHRVSCHRHPTPSHQQR